MADSRRPVDEDSRPVDVRQASQFEREERRLERLRLIVSEWSTAPPFEELDPDPKEAA
jgi:hypothetical protein